MADSGGSGGPRRGSFASRKARGEQGGTSGSAAAGGSGKDKDHGYDARFYHQNANKRGIHALKTFDCPVCDSKNTIRIDLNTRLREGTVRCTYCMSLRPIPDDLPYPYTTPYVPALENKADVFFKFNELYTALLRRQMSDEGPSSLGLDTADRDGTSAHAAVGAGRKRVRDDDDDNGEAGLLGGLDFYPSETGLVDGGGNAVGDSPPGETNADPYHATEEALHDSTEREEKEGLLMSTAFDDALDDHGVYGGVDGEEGSFGDPEDAKVAPATGEEMDEMDIAAFFADSD